MRICCFFMLLTVIISCAEADNQKPVELIDSAKAYRDYIKPIQGKSDSIPVNVSQKGEVLIAYSDCYSCHSIEKRLKGPAFKDIAKRYPVNEGYVALLARRIIVGGSGA